jgi:hypothetical protein
VIAVNVDPEGQLSIVDVKKRTAIAMSPAGDTTYAA